MGNMVMVRSKKAKLMKIDGDTFRLKTPVTASDATKEYPGYVLLDSEAVKRFGVRAKPLEPNQILTFNRTYFLVQLPKLLPEERDKRNKFPYRRVMSGIHVGAKERLEMLMLSRRTVSDVVIGRSDDEYGLDQHRHTRVKLRLPRSQIKKLMKENYGTSEVAARIIDGYLANRDSDGLRRKPEVEGMKSHYRTPEKQVSFAEIGGRGEIVVL